MSDSATLLAHGRNFRAGRLRQLPRVTLRGKSCRAHSSDLSDIYTELLQLLHPSSWGRILPIFFACTNTLLEWNALKMCIILTLWAISRNIKRQSSMNILNWLADAFFERASRTAEVWPCLNWVYFTSSDSFSWPHRQRPAESSDRFEFEYHLGLWQNLMLDAFGAQRVLWRAPKDFALAALVLVKKKTRSDTFRMHLLKLIIISSIANVQNINSMILTIILLMLSMQLRHAMLTHHVLATMHNCNVPNYTGQKVVQKH